jgi:hypothetical protein
MSNAPGRARPAPDYEGILAWAKARSRPGTTEEEAMRRPIRPEEAAARKLAQVPDEVIDIFNALIEQSWDGHSARVDQKDVITAIMRSGAVKFAQEIFSRHLLEVEPIYTAAGWIVSYEKPGYNETGATYFIFEEGE